MVPSVVFRAAFLLLGVCGVRVAAFVLPTPQSKGGTKILSSSSQERVEGHRNLRRDGRSGLRERAALQESSAVATGEGREIRVVPSIRLGGEEIEEDVGGGGGMTTGRIVMVTGFESFNLGLYRQAVAALRQTDPWVDVKVFTDRDIISQPDVVQSALEGADVCFCSLIFDFDQVSFLQRHLEKIRYRFIFESALELMGMTEVNSFKIPRPDIPTLEEDGPKKKAGPPPAVKAVLRQFGQKREEDRMSGYLSLLKSGPKLLKFIPGDKAADLRFWLQVYSYWNQGGQKNVENMLRLIGSRCLADRTQQAQSSSVSSSVPVELPAADTDSSKSPLPSSPTTARAQGSRDSRDLFEDAPPLEVVPPVGLFHPRKGIFESAGKYIDWYEGERRREAEEAAQAGETAEVKKRPRLPPPDAPRVALLLYRKHVVSGLRYVSDLIEMMEKQGVVPVPFFITGVEAHVIVRDYLTSSFERANPNSPFKNDLRPDALEVDAVVNTIGFPLVGGPAGSMEAGRQVKAAVEILKTKNIPYAVAAPLLTQDIPSWMRSGVQGLQSTVIYSLPELDGAVEPFVLGGLVGDKIALVPERVRRLVTRLKRWVRLRKKEAAERRVSVLLYGFPPNVGALGTAALLNVPASLSKLLEQLREEGYDLGPASRGKAATMPIDGEGIVSALQLMALDPVVRAGPEGTRRAVCAAVMGDEKSQHKVESPFLKAIIEESPKAAGELISAETVSLRRLKEQLGAQLFRKLADSWGLSSSSGQTKSLTTTLIGQTSQGDLLVSGIQLGNVFIGVQPLLGFEGDPMRLLFERDLTPHPHYCAFYKTLTGPLSKEEGEGRKSAVASLGKRKTGGSRGKEKDQHQWVDSGEEPLRSDVMLHFGMHGTYEWLPGSPLGNTAQSWPDVLMGSIPGLYLYCANNPSESILSKRRGVSAIVSHNVPPYSRAGLYKELASLKEMIDEFRETDRGDASEAEEAGSGEGRAGDSVLPIVEAVSKLGLWKDCPYIGKGTVGEEGNEGGSLDADALTGPDGKLVSPIPIEMNEFRQWLEHLRAYLLELQNRLFSEGLHVLGERPGPEKIEQYLQAYFADDPALAEADIQSIARSAPLNGKGSSPHSAASSGVSPKNIYPAGLPLKSQVSFYLRRFLGLMGVGRFREETDLEMSAFNSKSASVNWNLSEEREKEMRQRGVDREGTVVGAAAVVSQKSTPERLKEATAIRDLLLETDEEMTSMLKGLRGEYIPPAPGGDLLRDGPGVLPTGRNIHALDPYRMPSPAAWSRGQEIAKAVLEAETRKALEEGRASDESPLPETVAVTLWGLDAIKTRGESVAVVLALVGARPVKEATGRIVRFELLPLEELGRPRVDVLCSMSGIFRDTFGNVVEMLDDLFKRAAEVDEPVEMNFIKKHAKELEDQGEDRAHSRLFSNPAGDFGSMVNERVGSSDWTSSEELGDTWTSRNAFSFGKGGETGKSRAKILQHMLGTTERVVQQIDSVEYGLTDIQEYYANTGALKKAAENAAVSVRPSRKKRRGGVGVSVVETYSKDVTPRELESLLRVEYRTKLLNPKWSEAMMKQGSGGAYEIGQRMTALLGWGATAEFREQWVYEGAADRYANDEEVAARLAKLNPEAFRNVVRRLLEAHGRGFWTADEKTLQRLQELDQQTDDMIEGVVVAP
uniref:magnesium chelatase n=1 Tax=Chromera velia CCMP2878 TaxID=1169474 RepID=A0A0G4IDP0_9ALVE|eukprot:Cvel_13438.t1-p1 / transcript=Cvel_13438.t1 / gene=Cvel_13438 / organism=Chromera_velia_CCMP2878 / gene_product=Magnesium-chelatase subunit ChlH, chloroplastic, putative / transcript_product=Magnesium-chelatase subunit ChlH, chloroplastic, putative / location=Cvel_scaffold917:36426-45495(-) / protein_length=1664 / sequence_SO=supercontig / SO=protein_coding / is_pseudo=false